MSQIDDEFIRKQKEAVQRMNEMMQRSKFPNERHTMPPAPPFVKIPDYTEKVKENGQSGDFKEGENPKAAKKVYRQGNNAAFNPLTASFNLLKADSDVTLIIGLLLLLINENADRKLLIALLYILM